MECAPCCIVCQRPGVDFLSPQDSLALKEEAFSLKKCPFCGLLWVNPRPNAGELTKYYKNYFPHTTRLERKSLKEIIKLVRNAILCRYYGYLHLCKKHLLCRAAGIATLIPGVRLKATHELGWLFPHFNKSPHALLIDIGCGEGNFLKTMKELGWDVLGIEAYHDLTEFSKANGIKVFAGTLEEMRLADSIAEFVIMDHAFEHLPDPRTTIQECVRILRPGGTLVMRLPNAESLGFAMFVHNWFGLDAPRHLFTFSPTSIRLLLKQFPFKEVCVKTSARTAGHTYVRSKHAARHQKSNNPGVVLRIQKRIFAFQERLLCACNKECGEEIEVRAIK